MVTLKEKSKHKNKEVTSKKKPGKFSQHKCTRFTSDEDKILSDAIFSGSVTIREGNHVVHDSKIRLLAEQLGRHESSVRERLNKLNRTGT